mmetsp:Transcript_53858/g.122998  ORF Transcript_53858/g.122998 Transcript_53858/m.122998 type:complete len:204 (-) Transcript_53858:2706-3317(-)
MHSQMRLQCLLPPLDQNTLLASADSLGRHALVSPSIDEPRTTNHDSRATSHEPRLTNRELRGGLELDEGRESLLQHREFHAQRHLLGLRLLLDVVGHLLPRGGDHSSLELLLLLGLVRDRLLELRDLGVEVHHALQHQVHLDGVAARADAAAALGRLALAQQGQLPDPCQRLEVLRLSAHGLERVGRAALDVHRRLQRRLQAV